MSAEAARSHQIVTVLVARSAGGGEAPAVDAQPDADGWAIEVGGLRARIAMVDGGALGPVPEVTWS